MKTFKTQPILMQQIYAFVHVTITKDFVFPHWQKAIIKIVLIYSVLQLFLVLKFFLSNMYIEIFSELKLEKLHLNIFLDKCDISLCFSS